MTFRLLARRVISRQRSISVAFGAKRTLSRIYEYTTWSLSRVETPATWSWTVRVGPLFLRVWPKMLRLDSPIKSGAGSPHRARAREGQSETLASHIRPNSQEPARAGGARDWRVNTRPGAFRSRPSRSHRATNAREMACAAMRRILPPSPPCVWPHHQGR
jgi:hypothetical protein